MSKINELGWSGIGLGIVGIFGAGYLLFKGKDNKRESSTNSESWNDKSGNDASILSSFPRLSGEKVGGKRKSRTKKRR